MENIHFLGPFTDRRPIQINHSGLLSEFGIRVSTKLMNFTQGNHIVDFGCGFLIHNFKIIDLHYDM